MNIFKKILSFLLLPWKKKEEPTQPMTLVVEKEKTKNEKPKTSRLARKKEAKKRNPTPKESKKPTVGRPKKSK